MDPLEYDTIVIGTPVWAWHYTPAIRSFLSTVKLSGKKIALFCCCGQNAKQTIPSLEKALDGNEIIGTKEFITQPPDAGALSEAAAAWVASLPT